MRYDYAKFEMQQAKKFKMTARLISKQVKVIQLIIECVDSALDRAALRPMNMILHISCHMHCWVGHNIDTGTSITEAVNNEL